MATDSQGDVTIMLTKEGAAKANLLKQNGLDVKLTHMRIYRTPTPVQNIPYKFTGSENQATLNGWSALPNTETKFPVIENFTDSPLRGYLTVMGTLGPEIGTFSYDAAALFFEDDTLYAICVTSRLLTKRKAAVGTTSNIQELSFNIGHETVDQRVDFKVKDIVVDYTKISELQYPHLLPKQYNKDERIFRITNSDAIGYQGNKVFNTHLASQSMATLKGTSKLTPIWYLADHIQMFDFMTVDYKVLPDNKVSVTLPASTHYPEELVAKDRLYVLCLADPDTKIEYPALSLVLNTRSVDATGISFIFDVLHVQTNVLDTVILQGMLFTKNDDSIYHDAIKTALRNMAKIQYAPGRRFKTDNLINPSEVLKPFLGEDTNWQEYDNRIEVSTSQYDGRLLAPSMLQPTINKAGTEKGIKLRASHIWLRDAQNDLKPILDLDRYLLSFGQIANATITADGYPDGSMIAWYCIPSKSDLLLNPTRNYGYAKVMGGVAAFTIEPRWSRVASQDSVKVGLVGYPEQETILSLELLEVDVFFSTDETGTERITNSGEGTSVFFHVRTKYGQETDTTLYTKFMDDSSTDEVDFEDGSPVPAYVELVKGKYVKEIKILADNKTEGTEILHIGICPDSSLETILGQAALSISDTSLTPNPQYDIYMAYDELGQRKVGAGQTHPLGGGILYIIVTATEVPPVFEVTVDFAGTLDRTNDVIPVLPNSIKLTLNNGFASYPINTVEPDVTIPEEPSGPNIRELRISADRLTTYNLYDEFVYLFGTPTANDSVKLYIDKGVNVVGTDTSMPAIDCTGNWPTGLQPVIENAGNVMGRGGNGGVQNRGDLGLGTKGGDGIKAQPANPVVVNNSGIVAGGGGGGGCAWIRAISMPGDMYPFAYLQSGSGGRPLGKGGGKGTAPKGYVSIPIQGQDATLAAPGKTARFSTTGATLEEMSGGDLGQPGSPGRSSNGYNGIAGVAGYRTVGPVVINNIGTGAYFGEAG